MSAAAETTTTTYTTVTSRASKKVHKGYQGGAGVYRALCGQAGRFGKAYGAEENCAKCAAAYGQGAAAVAAARTAH
jgi:hypothetical protein